MGIEIRSKHASKPYKVFPIEIVELSKLVPHEMTIPIALESFKSHVVVDEMVIRPIIVDQKSMIILDGHHRRQGLLELGYTHGPAIMIDYLDDSVVALDTWYPLVNIPSDILKETFSQNGITFEQCKNLDECLTMVKTRAISALLINDNQSWVLQGDRESIFKIIRDNWLDVTTYYDDAKICIKHALNRNSAIISWPYTKKEILQHTNNHIVHLPKTTRHTIQYHYPDCNYPLNKLSKN